MSTRTTQMTDLAEEVTTLKKILLKVMLGDRLSPEDMAVVDAIDEDLLYEDDDG